MEKESKIIRVNSQQPLTLLNWGFSEMGEFVTLDSVFAGDIFPNFGHLVLKALSPKMNVSIFLEIVTATIN